MAKTLIGYFCGTGYETHTDAAYISISHYLDNTSNFFGYDGCQIYGGGMFAYGVEEQANNFMTVLRDKVNVCEDAEELQLNLIAHSRGALSALLVIQKIQADPALNKKVKVTADLHDPVPGNLQLTTKIAGSLAIANQVCDLSDCDVVKKVYITLQEKPNINIGFDAMVPKFHHMAKVEIETLPGYHDAQHTLEIFEDIEHTDLTLLGAIKSLSILLSDGHVLIEKKTNDKISAGVLKLIQLGCYERLINWIKTRVIPFGERDLHFGGKISANNHAVKEVDYINWRHAHLAEATPSHVLYGTNQPHYNHLKTATEYYADITMALDKFLIKNPENKAMANGIKQLITPLINSSDNSANIRKQIQDELDFARVKDKNIIKAVNYMFLHSYFKEFDAAVSEHITTDESPLFAPVQQLRHVLVAELVAGIERGKSLNQIAASKSVQIAKNSAAYLEKLFSSDQIDLNEICKASELFVDQNLRLGKNWRTGIKVILGALITVAAAVVGSVVGAAIGLGVGLALGLITGPGVIFTMAAGACTCGFKGALIAGTAAGTFLGLGAGMYGQNYFFAPSPVERHVQALAAAEPDLALPTL